jgi:hypothetical protein
VADPAATIGPADLRAAVAAGIMTERQAASLTVLAQGRAGQRSAMPPEDEPFEFFRGFSEIFVSIGLIILLTGIAAVLSLFGGLAIQAALPLVCAGIAWWWAGYFTLKRRMNLPSMVLALAFGIGVFLSSVTLLGMPFEALRLPLVGSFVIAALAMALWYRRFRLPFAAFILGLFLLGALYVLTASLESLTGLAVRSGGFAGFFDLRQSPQFALATLAFGIAAFLAAMWFDTRDPHRLGRYAATAFWLHLLAAPALVNTVALTLYNVGGTVGIVSLALALTLISVLALIIDRRSFLTAAIGYIALVISWIVQGGRDDLVTWAMILILLGAFITALGTWWVPLRSALMQALPRFPGKDRLPPYARTT